MERLIKAGPPPPSPARLPACAQAEDMWKLKVPSGGGKDGRTDGGEASFCMARARGRHGAEGGRGRRRRCRATSIMRCISVCVTQTT